MAGSGSGSNGYGSSSGKGSYSGGSAKGGYALADAKSYAGGIFGKGGLAVYLSGYGNRGYLPVLNKSYSRIGITDSYLKANNDRLCSERESRAVKKLLEVNPDYSDSFKLRDLEERVRKHERIWRGESGTGYSTN
jgi:hypothetical protein